MDIPYVNYHLDADHFRDDMMKVFEVIRPSWFQEDVVFRDMCGGYNNVMMKCYLRTDRTLDDVIVIRVYGANHYAYAADTQELMAMQLAGMADCFPPPLVIFPNGVAYEYFRGRNLDGYDLIKPEVIRCVARKLAQYKSMDPEKHKLLDHKGKRRHFDTTAQWEVKMSTAVERVPDSFEDDERQEIFSSAGLDRDTLRAELDLMHRKLHDLKLPVCLSHSDFHINNIVYNESTNDAILVDYEFAEMSYEYLDFVQLLSVPAVYKVAGFLSPDCPDVPDSVKSLWIRNYVERKYELQGRQSSEIPEVIFEKAEIEFALAEIYHTLRLCVLTIQHAKVPGWGIRVLRTLPTFKDLWLKRKHRLPELEERYQQLTAPTEKGTGPPPGAV